MTSAADARRFVAEYGLEDNVAKAVADAPEPSDAQRESLSAIFHSPNATEAGAPPAPVLANHRQPDGLGTG